jgi:hypothetical protein
MVGLEDLQISFEEPLIHVVQVVLTFRLLLEILFGRAAQSMSEGSAMFTVMIVERSAGVCAVFGVSIVRHPR